MFNILIDINIQNVHCNMFTTKNRVQLQTPDEYPKVSAAVSPFEHFELLESFAFAIRELR
eukprot:SAG31_NODE_6258_length_2099_cov_4.347500_2_plen_60_part_00